MGHKVNPIGLRLGITRTWGARWYADKQYPDLVLEDYKLRKAIRENYREGGIASVQVERKANEVTITLFSSRPGIIIGKGGQRIDEMRRNLEKLTGKKVRLNIQEIRQPEMEAVLVARNIADQMERRVAYRRAMKQALLRTMQSGAKGIKITCAGRLGGAEIARRETVRTGRVPLQTLRADIDYGFEEAHTTLGRIGVKVWIYKGDIFKERPEEAFAEAKREEKPGAAPKAEAKPVATTTEKSDAAAQAS
ncbi:MAG: 30S ribosomal protein S3 [Chloroflexi bacterium]|nr:30S ribosomal protein S3 [Chloroflexota bacterium]